MVKNSAKIATPINVSHVVLSMDLGGLERVVMHLLRQAPAHDQRTSIVCLERPGSLSGEIESLGVPLRCAQKRPGLQLGTIKPLRRIFEELQPDVVHTHQIGTLFYAGPAARRAGVPVVVHTEHGKHYESARLRTRLMARWAARYAHRFFCVSQDIAGGVVGRGIITPSKVEVILNGIDTRHFATTVDVVALRESLRIPVGAPVVGTVANLRRVKRQDVLVHGFSKVNLGPLPLPYLLLVGDGAERESLQRLATELGVAHRVRFAGSQSDPAPYLQLMDVFALTSESEGMPLSVLEAWAAGKPVVASRVGGLPALIDDGKTGLLFDFPDAMALAESLTLLLKDRDLRHRIGNDAADHVRSTLDVGVMARTYDNHYRGAASTNQQFVSALGGSCTSSGSVERLATSHRQ